MDTPYTNYNLMYSARFVFPCLPMYFPQYPTVNASSTPKLFSFRSDLRQQIELYLALLNIQKRFYKI